MNDLPGAVNLADSNSLPLVSILIPSYKPRWFKEALDSALAQDYPHLEIIVYDNCPTEEIYQICTQYPQVNYWRNPNTRLQNIIDIAMASKGRYIKFLFDDDLFEPECVSQMVKAIMQDQNVCMAFSHSWIIDENGEKQQHRHRFYPHGKITMIDGSFICKQITGNCANVIGEFSSILLDGQWLRSNPECLYIGGKTGAKFRGLVDVICYINASANRQVAFVDETLTSFRISTESNSNPENNPDFIDVVLDWKLVIEEGKALGVLDADDVLRAKIKYNRFVYSIKDEYPTLSEKILASMYPPDIFDGFDQYHQYEQLIAAGKENEAFELFQSDANQLYYWKIFQLMARIADKNNDHESARHYYFIASQNSWTPIDDTLRYARLLLENNEFNTAKSILEFFLREHPDSVQAKESLAICHINDRSSHFYTSWQHQKSVGGVDERDHQNRVQKFWKKQPLFELMLILKPGAEAWLADTIDSLSQQYYDGWRLSIFAQTPSPEPEFSSDSAIVRWIEVGDGSQLAHLVNKRLADSLADWIGFYECGTQFDPALLLNLGHYIAIRPEWVVIYTDEDKIEGRLFVDEALSDPLLKPDFNLEMLRSTDYIGDIWVTRKTLLDAGGFVGIPGTEKYDILLRVYDAAGESAIGHIQDILVHVPEKVRRRARNEGTMQSLMRHLTHIDADIMPGMVEGTTRRVFYRHPDTPKVSIIIPNKNHLELFGVCVESIFKQTAYPNWELLIVDNGSDDQHTLQYYETLTTMLPDRVKILSHPGEFNYSAMNNRAVETASGDYLLFLNNDTVCIHEDWLDALMSHAQRPEVGIVGARLLFPDSLKIQHAGVILGMNGMAEHVFSGMPYDLPGYMARTMVDQEYSAVTGACLLMRKTLFNAVQGFDEEKFKINCNDIDLCLKIRELGYKIIWTPFATLLHYCGASIKPSLNDEKMSRIETDHCFFWRRWQPDLVNDPMWNRSLRLSYPIPLIEDEYIPAWNPDFKDRLRVCVMPAPSPAVTEYRNLVALRNLHAQGKLHYTSTFPPVKDRERAPLISELMRMASDTLLLNTPIDDVRFSALLKYGQYRLDVLRVYSLDDLYSQIPQDNPVFKALPADLVMERIRQGLRASHRLIVSTEPLAHAYHGMIDDIRVIPNALDWNIWKDFAPKRRVSKKLRVGWAGAQQHAGDLKFITDVIKATHQEVDWVFFGMMPEGVAPYLAEYHEYLRAFGDYPAKLASLNLDLAIAPLEMHPFNEAKSNLKLLEYGVLGCPVICTDIVPYQTNNAPVTRLPNEGNKWIEAIREHADQPDGLAQEGDILKAWVKKNYLVDQYLDQWLTAVTR